MPITLLNTDIIVLGNGLSGLRAAWAAKEQSPSLGVTVASLRNGPSGSSFSNRNNALGIQLLDTDERKEDFAKEVMELGVPGFMDASLVSILAEEGEPRFREMEELGLDFRRLENGHLERFTGCGSPHRRAVIFDDLKITFNRFIKKTIDYKVGHITDLEILGILKNGEQACGAWGRSHSTGKLTAINARCVILALGGPAPLFAHHQAGAGNPGISYGLMADAGVKMENAPYLQYMWGLRDKTFQNLATLFQADNAVLREDNTLLSPAELFGHELESLRTARGTHCPTFYHRPQSALDQCLLDNAHTDGFTRLVIGDETIEVGLSAHAGNGGAVVDANAETSLFNLFAVGECATGMHGANRMGGAMVLATQVFGQRAGKAAAERAERIKRLDKKEFATVCQDIPSLQENLGTDRDNIAAIRTGLSRHGLFGGQTGVNVFRKTVTQLKDSPDRMVRLAALTALAVSKPLAIPVTATR